MYRKRFFLFLLFPLLSLALTAQNLDIRWLDRINGPVNPHADRPWQFISDITTPVSIGAPLTVLAFGIARHDKDLRIKSYEIGASFLLSTAITTAIKVSVHRPRPFVSYPDIITKKGRGGSLSFPSGHTTVAFATATSLSLAFPKWYVIAPSFAYAGAVAYSRMYLGMHYPSDVLGGIVVGVGASILSFQVSRWLQK